MVFIPAVVNVCTFYATIGLCTLSDRDKEPNILVHYYSVIDLYNNGNFLESVCWETTFFNCLSTVVLSAYEEKDTIGVPNLSLLSALS